MAYMNQEKKAKIAAALKAVVPADWKYSLAVRHHSTIVMTIRECPIDLIAAYSDRREDQTTPRKSLDVNPYHYKGVFTPEVEAVIVKIMECLNLDNFDKSDITTDYFHVGHYVDLNIGRWDKPFVCTGQTAAVAA